MRYILAFILIFFTGCNKNTKPDQPKTVIKQNKTVNKTETEKKENQITTVKISNLILKFKKNKLIFPEKKTIILFDNNNTYSKAQSDILKKLKVTFYKTDSEFLRKYFNIRIYPTIVVLENNKTVKYENFTPYEILKAEGF